MAKQINKAKSLLFGETPIMLINDGNSVDEVVIRYKDIYISFFVDSENQEPTGDWGWSEDPTNFSVPLRDIYTVSRKNNEDS